MASERKPYHAHIYYEPKQRPAAQRLLQRLAQSKFVLFAGELRDEPIGPHPKAQFEVHFREDAVPQIVALIKEPGLPAPFPRLTDDDLPDHPSLGQWIGAPI